MFLCENSLTKAQKADTMALCVVNAPDSMVALTYCTWCCVCSCLLGHQVAVSVEFWFFSLSLQMKQA